MNLDTNIKKIKETIAQEGREGEVLIVAATKTVDANRISQLKSYGIFDAGENRVQELLQKYDDVQGINWHFIGNLQKNKVKYIVDKVCLIHSVDSQSLALEINKRAGQIAKTMDVLCEVNIGKEPSKSGVFEEEVESLCDFIVAQPFLRLRGLMTVMPPNANEALYKRMQELFLDAKKRYADGIDYLSMGMSGDYATALRFGANIIRTGSAIFGARVY